MNGLEAFENKKISKINNLLEKENNIILNGFYNYISNMEYESIYKYLCHVRSFLNDVNKEVNDIDLDDFTSFMNKGRKNTKSYQIVCYSALKKFSKYLYISDRISKDYMSNVSRPKFSESEETKKKREEGFLTKAEVKKVLSNIYTSERTGYRDNALIRLMITTGMRKSACCKLDIESFNLQEKKITVTEKGSKVKTYLLPDDTAESIRVWLYFRNELENENTDNALFINKYGNRITPMNITKIIEKRTKCINRKVSPHKLRATYCTMIYEKTKDLYMVQQCMGHSNPKTTEIYIRGQKDQSSERARDIMNKMF